MNSTDIEGIKFLLAGKECISCAWRLACSRNHYIDWSKDSLIDDNEAKKLKLRRDLFHGDFGCSAPGRRWKIPDIGGCSHWMGKEEKSVFLMKRRNEQNK